MGDQSGNTAGSGTLAGSLIDKAATALLTLLVTGVGGGLVSILFTAYTRHAEQREEQARARATLGVAVEREVLTQTGALLADLRDARKLAVHDQPAMARAFFQTTLTPHLRAWNDQIFQIRNRTGMAFGAETARAIEDVSSRNYTLDWCARVIMRQQPTDLANCDALGQDEQDGLDWAIDQLNMDKPLASDGALVHAQNGKGDPVDVLYPPDFTANIRLASNLVDRLIACREAQVRPPRPDAAAPDPGPPAGPGKPGESNQTGPGCSNPDRLSKIVNGRVNLAGQRRAEIADAFLKVWTHSD